MDSVDYSKYSIEELEDVYIHIDRHAWPERVKEIESILHDPIKRQSHLDAYLEAENKRLITERYRKKVAAEQREKRKKKNEPLGYALLFLVMSILASFFGLVVWRTGQGAVVESLGERILYGLFFLGIAFIFFQKWRKNNVKRTSRR
jgi:hypothetical protein